MTDVVVVGAGPVGSALALDLARRDVNVRIIDRASGPFAGSRAKAVQPRTQEVLEDLGVLDALLAGAAPYPKLGIHLGPLTLPRTMIAVGKPTPEIPYPSAVLSPQFNTDRVLHEALQAAGVSVEYNTEVLTVEQDPDGVTMALSTGERVRSAYAVGADGGSSMVRKQAGITFTGSTDDEDRMVIADVVISDLRRNRWHIWPGTNGRFLGACPLPGGDLFQVMLRLPKATQIANDPATLQGAVRDALAARKLSAGEFRWVSLFRPNIRLADHYRSGRVFLAGDAAHAHTPAGGQGLNTGIQDAYNLGWKLGAVLHGADEDLLDTYESERRPIAAAVLKLSTERYESFDGNAKKAVTRGDEERQLVLNYRSSPLSSDSSTFVGGLRSGDRLPDAIATDGSRVFAQTAGPRAVLVGIGAEGAEAARALARGRKITVVEVPVATYGAKEPALVLVRPDGYIAAIAGASDTSAISQSLTTLG